MNPDSDKYIYSLSYNLDFNSITMGATPTNDIANPNNLFAEKTTRPYNFGDYDFPDIYKSYPEINQIWVNHKPTGMTPDDLQAHYPLPLGEWDDGTFGELDDSGSGAKSRSNRHGKPNSPAIVKKNAKHREKRQTP